MMNLKEFKRKKLKEPGFKKEYYKQDLAFEISQMLVEARILKGITQIKLAEMIETKQSGIARAESGRTLPSISFLERIAEALNTYLLPPRFAFLTDEKIDIDSKSTQATEAKSELLMNGGLTLSLPISMKLNTSSIGSHYGFPFREGGTYA